MNSLGLRIKALREKQSISQKDFAQKIGVSNTVLSRYESGDRKPDYEILQMIADFFNVSIDYLLGSTDIPTPIQHITLADLPESFTNNPALQKWYLELPKLSEKELEKLRLMWEVLHNEN